MNTPPRLIRIVLIETDRSLTAPVEKILHAKSALKLFSLAVVPTLSEAFREIDRRPPDVILMDIDPKWEPDLLPLTRLLGAAPETPAIALLSDDHLTSVPHVLHKGASGYLLASQFNEETVPAFLIRAIERHAAEKAVRESEERFRLMIENASDVILILDKASVIVYASPSTERILQYAPTALASQNAVDFIHRDDRLGFLDQFEKAFATGDTLPLVQFRFRRPEGTWLHMEGKGRIAPDASGTPVCILNSHDVSHRVKLEAELRSLALRDELTGLHNRRSFITVLEQQLKLAQRAFNQGMYLLFIDLDGFKGINDTFGHKEGDRILIEASRVLKTTFRDADLVARLGGDEFVVFLTERVAATDVEVLKRRLVEAVDLWNRQEKRPYRLAMSVGAVNYNSAEHRSSADLLRAADELMYKQKRDKKRQLAAAESTPN